ncbi:DUF3040 domain-containing protein [Geodermatophilus sp. SYSU D00708]
MSGAGFRACGAGFPSSGADRPRTEREALADINDALERDAPDLARSFGTLATPRPGRWLAGLAVCAVVAGAAFAVLGVRAVGVVALLLVLGGPVVVCLGLPDGGEPTAGPRGGTDRGRQPRRWVSRKRSMRAQASSADGWW